MLNGIRLGTVVLLNSAPAWLLRFSPIFIIHDPSNLTVPPLSICQICCIYSKSGISQIYTGNADNCPYRSSLAFELVQNNSAWLLFLPKLTMERTWKRIFGSLISFYANMPPSPNPPPPNIKLCFLWPDHSVYPVYFRADDKL